MNEFKTSVPYLDKYLDKNNKVIDSSTEWVDDDDEISGINKSNGKMFKNSKC